MSTTTAIEEFKRMRNPSCLADWGLSVNLDSLAQEIEEKQDGWEEALSELSGNKENKCK